MNPNENATIPQTESEQDNRKTDRKKACCWLPLFGCIGIFFFIVVSLGAVGWLGRGLMLIRIGNFYRDQGQYQEARDYYEEALAIFEKRSDQDEELDFLNEVGEIIAFINIGQTYHAQGDYTQALEMYDQALSLVRELEAWPLEGGILNNIGEVYRSQGRYAQALEMYQQALLLIRKLEDRTWEGGTLSNIGLVYWAQGRNTEALEMFQQALAIAREENDRVWEGTILNNVGSVYSGQGRYAEALAQYQRALTIHQAMGNRPVEGTTLNNIGEVYQSQGRYDAALKSHQQVLTIIREVGDRAGEGIILNNIGVTYEAQGHYIEALEMYQQALTIHREVGDRAGEGFTLSNIGGVYRIQGSYSEALETYQQALTIVQKLGNRAVEGSVFDNIGAVYDDQNHYAEALEMYQKALTIRRGVGDRLGEGITLNNIGVTYDNQGRYAEALKNYQQAMDILETIRVTAGSEQGRAGFIAQYAHLYTRAAGLFYQQGQSEDAFFTSERGRARALLDSLATGYVQLEDDEMATLLIQEQEAYAGVLAAQDVLRLARTFGVSNPDLIADLEAQLVEAEAAHATTLAVIESHGHQLAALVPGRSTVLGLSEVQDLLNEDTTLLSYFILEEEILIFLITHSDFEVVASEVSHQELTDRVSYFREAIPGRRPKAIQPAAQELYQLLIAPVAGSLHTSRLAIVPHGPLHYLPFAALVDPDTDQYLLNRHELVTLPSASALAFIRQNARDRDSEKVEELALVLGNPTTGDYNATASLALERAGLSPLPFAEKEAEAIAALYGVEPLLGSAATEGVVREQVAKSSVLHLAAHGQYNSVAPLSSLIALAPDDEYDGWLTVGEVYGLDLSQTDLVVLSACETQLGDLSAGDELVGLTRAFFFAGTPNVIATLWNVDDEATGLLMERFYTHLNAGVGEAAALRQAQLELMVNYPDPYYWAAFVLSGDGVR